MAIGRVSGSMLVSNLDRQGTDLQFTTLNKPLTYLDFSQFRVGINTNNLSQTLTVNGNLSTSNVLIDGLTVSAKNGSTLQFVGNVELGNVGNLKIFGGSSKFVLYTDGAGNLNWGNVTSDFGSIESANVALYNKFTLSSVNQLYYLSFTDRNSTGNSSSFIGSGLTFNPNTNNLSTTTFSGTFSGTASITSGSVTGITGSASTFTATNLSSGNIVGLLSGTATTSNVTLYNNHNLTSNNQSYLVVFTDRNSTGNSASYINPGLVFNPSSNSLSTTTFIGTFSGTAAITSGSITNSAGNFNSLQATDFSSGNVLISGGSVTGITGSASTFTATNLSSGNIVGLLSGTATTSNVSLYTNQTNSSANSNFYLAFTDRSTTGNSASYVNSSLKFNPATGNVSAPTISGNVITSNVTASNTLVFNTDVNPVVFNSNAAVKLPYGTTSNRPIGSAGYVRYNGDINSVEYYNGTSWVPVVNTVTDQVITGDGVNTVYTLDQTSTDVGVLVSINGTLQQPGVAYTVSGNQITFSEVPLVSDIIDVRFLGATVTLNSTLTDDLTVSGNLTLSGLLSQPLTTKANNSPGSTGQISWDGNYIYVCVATNTWKRVSLNSF